MAHKVRTTMQPWQVREVDDATFTDLKRQGLLATGEQVAAAKKAAAADTEGDGGKPAAAPAKSGDTSGKAGA